MKVIFYKNHIPGHQDGLLMSPECERDHRTLERILVERPEAVLGMGRHPQTLKLLHVQINLEYPTTNAAEADDAGKRIKAGRARSAEDGKNRLKIARMDHCLLIDLLNWRHHLPDVLCIPDGPGVPADAEVVSVWPNPAARSIDVLLRHDSFDPVPDGETVPLISETICELLAVPVSEIVDRREAILKLSASAGR